MPAHSWDDLYKTIRKGNLPAAVYLYGEEDPLKDELIQELLDRSLDPGLRDFNLDTRSAATLAPDDVTTLLTTLPMMADRRVVIIRDVEAWNKKAKAKQAVLDVLDKPSPETLVILVQGAGDREKPKDNEPDADLAKRAYAVNCERLPFDRAVRWVNKEAEKSGLSLTPDAVAHMVTVWESELGPLRAELAKLSGLAGGETLSLERVSGFLGVRRGETLPDWRDTVMNGDIGRAAIMLPRLLEQSGMSGVKMVTLLGQSLVGTALARAHRDDGKRGRAVESAVYDSMKRAKLWGMDYRTTAAAWSRWSEQWTAPRLRAAIAAATEADQALKETTISGDEGILTDLIMRLADPQRAAA
ncbi:MAG: DNA polymerase III subunit delta [Gemmatimonadales bacterium]